MYHLKGIYFRRGDFTLHIEDLQLQEGGINFILGKNGSGKSTLLKSLYQREDLLRGIKKVLLIQDSYVFNRSVEKNVAMVLQWNQSSQKAAEYLQLVGLEEKRNHRAKELSGGEQRRLAFAMALATEAPILMLDEPFVNIDHLSQNKLIDALKQCRQERTMVVVSHRSSIAKKVGDYFLLLQGGELKLQAGKDPFFAHPLVQGQIG